MRGFKIFAIIAAAVMLLAPTTAMARSHVSFSFNVFDCFPLYAPPPVCVVAPPPPVYVPCHPPVYYNQNTVVKEYHHYYHQTPNQYEQGCYEIRPSSPHHCDCPYRCR